MFAGGGGGGGGGFAYFPVEIGSALLIVTVFSLGGGVEGKGKPKQSIRQTSSHGDDLRNSTVKNSPANLTT